MLSFLLEKAPKSSCPCSGIVHREPTKIPTIFFPPTKTEAWESQPEIKKNYGLKENFAYSIFILFYLFYFTFSLELILLFKGIWLTLSKSICFFTYIYWSPSSQEGQRTSDLPILIVCQTVSFYRVYFGKLFTKIQVEGHCLKKFSRLP